MVQKARSTAEWKHTCKLLRRSITSSPIAASSSGLAGIVDMANEGLKTKYDGVKSLYVVVKPDDHVDFLRIDIIPFTHHGIVEKLTEGGRVIVIHYTDANGLSRDVEIRRDELTKIAKKSLCRIDNSLDRKRPTLKLENILHRARSRLGEREYSLKINNCEHFSNWCRNGAAVCRQIKYAFGTYAVTSTACLGMAAATCTSVAVASAIAVVPAAVVSLTVYAAVKITHKRTVRKLRKRYDDQLKDIVNGKSVNDSQFCFMG
ncbi:NC domain containing protein [Aphelenchoides avenae]|nr:NC domain containing protein [Aphelenchus avenae]